MKRILVAAALVVALVLGACGDDDSAGSGSKPQLTVSAAASLKNAFTQYGQSFSSADARFSFAGSDELAAQIQKGVKPDVFAAANTKLPDQLYEKGLVEKPTVFAGNKLVLAVPADGAKVGSLEDLTKSGTSVVIGAKAVPIGDYTRTVLGGLPKAQSAAILENVRSEEPDVAGIVGKLTQGAADAGFVYASDVRGAEGKLRAIELPDDVSPAVAYGVAVVKGAKQPEQAKKFIAGLLDGNGQQALDEAGFLPPPSG